MDEFILILVNFSLSFLHETVKEKSTEKLNYIFFAYLCIRCAINIQTNQFVKKEFIFCKFFFFYSYRIVFDFSHQTLVEKSTDGDFSLARFVTESRLAALSRVYLYDTPLFSATNENQRH